MNTSIFHAEYNEDGKKTLMFENFFTTRTFLELIE